MLYDMGNPASNNPETNDVFPFMAYCQSSLGAPIIIGTLGGVGGGGVGGLNAHNKDLNLRKYSPLPPSPLPP